MLPKMVSTVRLFIICIVIANVATSAHSQELGLCSQVYLMHQYCTRDQSGGMSVPSNHMSHRIGKAGPRGPPGTTGRAAVVDYSLINATIDDRLKSFDELVAKVNQLQDLLTWYKASNGYYYKVFAERVTYATAKAKCVEYGGILASRGPRDTHVRGDLVSLMKQDDPDHTWIGANDNLNEGTWVWEDGVVSTAMDWYRGQPDNSGNEDCAHYYHPAFGWKVNDWKCNIRMKFLCEKKYNVA